jgi:hypothetical protein
MAAGGVARSIQAMNQLKDFKRAVILRWKRRLGAGIHPVDEQAA